jgi:hypothetical protein
MQRGTFVFTVTATDASGFTANAMLSLSCHGHFGHHGHHGHHDDDAQSDQNQGNFGGQQAFADSSWFGRD